VYSFSVAGVLDFATALKLVKMRAEAMQKATEMKEQIMVSVAGLDRSVLTKLCTDAKAKNLDKDPVCQVANSLFPSGFAVGGTKKTMEALTKLATDARALQAKPLKTGGAFHTPLMAPAASELAAAIDEAASKMQPPRCSMYTWKHSVHRNCGCITAIGYT